MIVLYILLAVLVLLLMVTIHEFGHYIAGKILGFKINEFSIGFGKSLYSHKCKSGEIFSIRLFPLGGYCAFEGEEDDSEESGAFMKQKPWKRIIVLFNGAFFNFISAIVFCFILLVSAGYDIPQVYSVDNVVKITNCYEVSTVNQFTLKDNDKITKINGSQIVYHDETFEFIYPSDLATIFGDDEIYTEPSYQITVSRDDEFTDKNLTVNVEYNNNIGIIKQGDVIYKVNGVSVDFITNNTFDVLVNNAISSGENLSLTVVRDGEQLTIENVNFYDKGIKNQDGKYQKAIGISRTAYRFTVGEALVRSVPYTFGFAWKVLEALGGIITGQVGIKDIGGPIFTIGTMAKYSQVSFNNLLIFLPLISANLAIFNWLPIPALDGSKIFLTLIEWIKGKPLFSQKTENMIHTVGFMLLLGLVVVADLFHIITAII
ncbi:MAG: RIP metalloprotease RseP [Clostridiales bacterium]|nr:RIP metalloprotease RseP [Candidatus Apopatousia equi]